MEKINIIIEHNSQDQIMKDKTWAVISYMERTKKNLLDCLLLFGVTENDYKKYKDTYPIK